MKMNTGQTKTLPINNIEYKWLSEGKYKLKVQIFKRRATRGLEVRIQIKTRKAVNKEQAVF